MNVYMKLYVSMNIYFYEFMYTCMYAFVCVCVRVFVCVCVREREIVCIFHGRHIVVEAESKRFFWFVRGAHRSDRQGQRVPA